MTYNVIRRGNVIECDDGIKYLRLCTDLHESAYVLREYEKDVPAGLKNLLSENSRLQIIFMDEFKRGLTGIQMLSSMLSRARRDCIQNPKIYAHSIELFLHEAGPLIGLPWEQVSCPDRGDVKLEINSCFAMELSVEDIVPEWENQKVRLPTEQIVLFSERGCEPFDHGQVSFLLFK